MCGFVSADFIPSFLHASFIYLSDTILHPLQIDILRTHIPNPFLNTLAVEHIPFSYQRSAVQKNPPPPSPLPSASRMHTFATPEAQIHLPTSPPPPPSPFLTSPPPPPYFQEPVSVFLLNNQLLPEERCARKSAPRPSSSGPTAR